MKTIIRYPGGKSKAYDLITSKIPNNIETIISPFVGGGSCESRWASELGIKVKSFDIFHALTNWWNQLLNNNQELALEMSKLIPNKEEYARIKELLVQWEYTQDILKDWKTDFYKRDPIHLDPVVAAAYYYYNHNLSYGPMYLGWISKIYENQDKWDKMIQKVINYYNPNLSVEQASFDQVIPAHKNDFLWLDPPYLLKEDSMEGDEDNQMTKPLYPMCNIPVHHKAFDHEKLRDLLHNHDGPWVMTYNNCETIREWYKDFIQETPEWHYSFALGEKRVGKHRKDRGLSKKKSHELLIIKP